MHGAVFCNVCGPGKVNFVHRASSAMLMVL